MRKFLVFVVMLAAARTFAFPVQTNVYPVNISDPTTTNIRIPQGETRYMEFRLSQNDEDVNATGLIGDFLYKSATMTNWAYVAAVVSTNRVVFPWGPAYDVGDMRYEGWVRLRDTNSVPAFRIKVDLAMISTPGFSPNPVAVADASLPADLPKVAALTYTGTNIVSDFANAQSFRVSLTNSVYLDPPTNVSDGEIVKWWFRQGTGNNTVTLDPMYKLPTGTTTLSLSTNVNANDCLIGVYDASTTNVYLTGLLLYEGN